MTQEERDAIAKSELVAHFAPKQPPVEKEIYTPKAKSWATGFLTHPSQGEINRPDNYIRALRKTPSSKTGSGTASGKRDDVAQLGQQSNKSIAPLVVLPSGHVSATNLLPLTFREDFAAEAGITLSQLENEELSLPGVQDLWKWECGKSCAGLTEAMLTGRDGACVLPIFARACCIQRNVRSSLMAREQRERTGRGDGC